MRNIPAKLSALAIAVISCVASQGVFAKPVNMYEEPKTDAKVVATIDSSSSMVPIISNKNGDWMKVGDPKNGTVGWVKLNDFSDSKNGTNASGFSMTAETVNTPSGPQTYRTIKFGNNQAAADNAKVQAVVQKYQEQQAQILQNTEQMYNNMYKEMNAIYQANPSAYMGAAIPVFMPVIVVPTPVQAPATPPAPPVLPSNMAKPPAPPKP